MTKTEQRHWKDLVAEANDAIGAARDAFTRARTAKARRDAAEDLDWWIGRKAFVMAAGEAGR